MTTPKKTYVDTVKQIYSNIRTRGYRTDDERSWLIRKVGMGSHLHIGTSTHELYEGHGGIAMFLALVSKCLGIQGSRKLAIEAVTPLADLDADTVDVGVGRGIGGHIYALTIVGRHTDTPRLVDEAVALAREITVDNVASDSEYDIMQGSAGLLLSLLTLLEERPNDDLLKRAIDCGDHLLESRLRTDEGHNVWATGVDGSPLVGSSHGSSGIVYALSRLYDVTGAIRFKRAAMTALNYEQTQFSTEANNWRDCRDETDEFTDSWCHGRAGICMGRSRTSEFLSADFTSRTVAAADAMTEAEVETDQLCCGNAGLVDSLLELEKRTDSSVYGKRAHELGQTIVERRPFLLPAHGRSLFNPTLFQGASGIGYVCLRLAFPGEVPCLLLFE